jgi:hypothetical protein
MVGPFGATDAGIHTISTRTCMFVPFELVSIIMGKDYTASEAFEISHTLLEDTGLDGVCAPFLEFLQVASTHQSEEIALPVALQDEMGLVKRTIRPVVIQHRRETILYHFLPEVRPTTVPASDAFVASMSDGLTHIAAEMHVDRRARDMRAVETLRKKTFRYKYGERIVDILLLLTGASDDYLLPTFYQELGGRKKGESEHVILQREVNQRDEVLGVLPFKVTPSQSIALKTFDFCGLVNTSG